MREKKENLDSEIQEISTPIRFDKARFKEWIKRDFFYILLLLFALFACIYTWDRVDDVNNSCNAHWIEQWENCHCMCLSQWEAQEMIDKGDVFLDGLVWQEPKNYTLEQVENAIEDTRNTDETPDP